MNIETLRPVANSITTHSTKQCFIPVENDLKLLPNYNSPFYRLQWLEELNTNILVGGPCIPKNIEVQEQYKPMLGMENV